MKKHPVRVKSAIETLENLARKKDAASHRSLLKKIISFARRLISRPLPALESPSSPHTTKEIQRKVQPLEVEKNSTCKIVDQRAIYELAPSKQELDAFRMKAISLLNQYQVRFTSFTEQLHMIREVPIRVLENTTLSKTLTESILSLQQTIIPLPGEIIELKGAFKRYAQSHCHSVPIPDSFHLKTQSHQIGFPHPCQHNGWALTPLLLPADPQVLQKMQEFSQKLTPQGSLNTKAKEMLKLKQACVAENAEEFFKLHKKLNQAIFKAAQQKNDELLNAFFGQIENQKKNYMFFCDLQHGIVKQYLENVIYDVTSDHFDYIQLMGTSLQIIMQKKPTLLEKLAFKQLQDFFVELEEKEISNTHEMFQWMQEMFFSDLLLF